MELTQPFIIRQARPDEFEPVFELLGESIQWLRSKGLDQWSTWRKWREKMRPSLEGGDVWLLCDRSLLVGTITVERAGDPDFWTSIELAEPAGYVSKLAIRRQNAGQELGRLMLEWASDHIYRQGGLWLRLDAWKTNTALHEYYRQRGWTYVRTADVDGRKSGALFQTRAHAMPASAAGHIEEVPGMQALETHFALPAEALDVSGSWRPDHTHVCAGLTIDSPVMGRIRPAELAPDFRYRLRYRDKGWLLEVDRGGARWREVGKVADAPIPLNPGREYVLTHQGADDKRACVIVVTEQTAAAPEVVQQRRSSS